MAPSTTGFDRTPLEAELSLSLTDLRQQGPEALRAHVQRLADLYTGLDLAHGMSPEDRRNLSDRLLVRVAQVGLLVRERDAAGAAGANTRQGAPLMTSLATGATGFLTDNSLLVIGLLGGVVVAYALGSLAGYRRGTSQASYYGAGDPRLSFVTRNRQKAPEPPTPITLGKVREALAAEKTVLLQLEYEIVPKHRHEFLRWMQEMQKVLNEAQGNVQSVWEDPRHPNRFYEIIVCERLETLDLLTRNRSELVGLDSKVEGDWIPGGPVVRRAWWGVLAGQGEEGMHLLGQVTTGRLGEDRVS